MADDRAIVRHPLSHFLPEEIRIFVAVISDEPILPVVFLLYSAVVHRLWNIRLRGRRGVVDVISDARPAE